MANSNLENNLYDYNGKKMKYTALAMKESRLRKAKELCETLNKCEEFNSLGGDVELKKLESVIHTAQNADYSVKKTGMDAGRENEFIKTHEKDRDNANPTGVGGIPKVNKGKVSDKIMSNREVYNEAINKEISEVRYLIEYMNNNKKQNL
jgi:hypothetical protein